MAKQVIGIGNAANDGSGDPLRTAGDKINDNFNEFYSKVGDGSNLHPLTFPNVTGTVLTTANSNVGATTTSSSDADHVLINDGGILKKITPANLGIGSGGGGGVTIQNEGNALSTAGTTLNFVGAGVTASGGGATKTITIAGGTSQNLFDKIAVSGQSNVVADSATDTLTLVAGTNVTITTDANADSITINSTGTTDLNSLTAGVINTQNDSIGFIDADDSNNSKKESIADFLTAIAGTGISVSSGQLTAANVSTFGATLIDDADAAAARTTLGLGTAATLATDNNTFVLNPTSLHVSNQKAMILYNDVGYIAIPLDITAALGDCIRLYNSSTSASDENFIECHSSHGGSSARRGNIHYNPTDGFTVESIGALTLQSNTSNIPANTTLKTIKLTDTNFSPITGDTGTLDLGTSSAKWKDIHLSGTANVGSIAYTFNVGNNGSSNYTFSDAGNVWFPTTASNPVLYLRRGEIYNFAVNASGHPFEIRVSNGGSAYSTGVTNNGAEVGTVIFKVPMSAPATLYYQCTNHSGMGAVINIV